VVQVALAAAGVVRALLTFFQVKGACV
jgi:hypothetical protein